MAGRYSLRNLGLILNLGLKISKNTLQRWFTEERLGKRKGSRAVGTRTKMTKDFAWLDDAFFEGLKDTHSLKVIYKFLGLRDPLAINNDVTQTFPDK